MNFQRYLIWFVWFANILYPGLCDPPVSDSPVEKEYRRIISAEFPKDSQVLDLAPVLHKYFHRLDNYNIKLEDVSVTFGKKHSLPRERFSCWSKQPLEGFFGYICVDTSAREIRTTKRFNPSKESIYKYSISMTLLDAKTGSFLHDSSFIISIIIMPVCKAKTLTKSSMEYRCEPDIVPYTPTTGTMNFVVINKPPYMITELDLGNYNLSPGNPLRVIITNKSKTVIYDDGVTKSDNNRIQLNVLVVEYSPVYKVKMISSKNETVTPAGIHLYLFEMKKFCKKSVCYSSIDYWKFLTKIVNQDCGEVNSTLVKFYDACKEISYPPEPFITANTSNFHLGNLLKLVCKTRQDIFIPHAMRIQRLSDAVNFVTVSKTSTLQIDSLKRSDMTYYRCVVRTITSRQEEYISKLFHVDIKDVFKAMVKYILNVRYDKDLSQKDNSVYQEFSQNVQNDILSVMKETYNTSLQDVNFSITSFQRSQRNFIEVSGIISLTRSTKQLLELTEDQWINEVTTVINNETPQDRKASETNLYLYSKCAAQNTTSKRGTYSWRALDIDQTSQQPCTMDKSKNITATCLLNQITYIGELLIYDKQCPIDKRARLKELSEVIITPDNAKNVSRDIKEITEDTRNIRPEHVHITIASLDRLVDFVSEDVAVRSNVFQIIDNLMNVSDTVIQQSQNENSTSEKLLDIISKTGERVSANPPFIVSRKHFALGSLKISNNTDVPSDITTSAKFSSGGRIKMNMSNADDSTDDVSVKIPGSIIRSLDTDGKNISVVTIVFDDNKLFQKNGPKQTDKGSPGKVGTFILSVDIRQHTIQDLIQPITMSFKSTEKDMKENIFTCSYWEEETRSWSTDGVSNKASHDGIYECASNHMTNFAVLFNAKPPKSVKHQEILSIITYLGLGLSMAGAVLTLLTYLIFPILRQSIPPRILINLCIALILTSIIFVVGVERSDKSKAACQCVGFLLQYFLLAVFVWCAIEGFHSTRGLVFPMKTEIRGFVKKAMAFGWGIPILLTAIGFGISSDEYASEYSCVVGGIPFYVTFLAPVIIIIIFNIVCLVSIMFSLKSSSEKYTTNALTPKERARIITAFIILFGLTWFFGFFVVGNDMVVFQYLFCIISAMQGLYVFIFYGLRNKKVRLFWRALFRGKNPSVIQRSSTRQLKGKKKRAYTQDTTYNTSDVTDNTHTSTYSLATITDKKYEQKQNGNPYTMS